MKVLIIIPAYNEEKNIERVVDNLISNFPRYDYIVINDGSKDSTAQICEKRKYKFINLPINIGLSGAVQAGMKYAYENGYTAALQFDGDGQHNPEYIDLLCKNMEEKSADIVIASRFKAKHKQISMRMVGSILLELITFVTTRQQIKDPTSGMRLFNRTIMKEFAYNINYGPEPDTIAFLINNGAKVIEVQTEMNERQQGTSYLTITRAIRYMINMCVSIVFIQWFRKKRT